MSTSDIITPKKRSADAADAKLWAKLDDLRGTFDMVLGSFFNAGPKQLKERQANVFIDKVF